MNPRPLDPLQVVNTVCRYYHVRRQHLMRRPLPRDTRTLTTRWVICWLLRRMTDMSFPEIGKAVDLDHSSVLWGAKRIEQRRHEDQVLAAQLEELETYIEQRHEERALSKGGKL